ncbi:hypothetical protein IG631_18806 [Alternaria alternata]|nr:hypothetical protein IG631_18806 [Alternaria alternata]
MDLALLAGAQYRHRRASTKTDLPAPSLWPTVESKRKERAVHRYTKLAPCRAFCGLAFLFRCTPP